MDKKPVLDIMVDLETASIKEDAAILSWTMLPFSPKSEEVDATYFHRVISLTSCFLAGMSIDRDTQDWWVKQDPLAKDQLIEEKNVTISQAANDAFDWLSDLSERYDIYLWSRGIDFDIPKMIWCFKTFAEEDESKMPFKYSHKTDVRSVLRWMNINPLDYEFKGTKHCSFDDCMFDVMLIQEAYKKLVRAFEGLNFTETPKQANENFSECLNRLGANKTEQEQEFEETIQLPRLHLVVKHGFYNEQPNTLSWKDLQKIEYELLLCHNLLNRYRNKIDSLENHIVELESK